MKGFGRQFRNTLAAEASAEWRNLAACRGDTTDLHFPVGSTGPAALQIAEAKAVCRGCAAISDCLRFAMDNSIADGVWGGLDEEERRARRRRGDAVSRLPSEPERSAAEDLADGATIREVADRHGLSQWRVERLSAQVRRQHPTPPRPPAAAPSAEVEAAARQRLLEGWSIHAVHQSLGVPRRTVQAWAKRAKEAVDAP